MCVCDRCRAFFCHLKHVHSPLWLFWTQGRSVGAYSHTLTLTHTHTHTHTSCTETAHIHLVPTLFATETFGSVETSRKQTFIHKGWVIFLIRVRSASVKPDSCPSRSTNTAGSGNMQEETQETKLTYNFLPCLVDFLGRCASSTTEFSTQELSPF